MRERAKLTDEGVADMTPEQSRSFLRSLPGYPFLPCKICGFTGSCDHIGWERARAWHPGLVTGDAPPSQGDQ